jgi:hypothetical protein
MRKIIAINNALPGVLDREPLCGEDWIFNNALRVSKGDIDAQRIEVVVGEKKIKLSNNIKSSDRKIIFRNFVKDIHEGIVGQS